MAVFWGMQLDYIYYVCGLSCLFVAISILGAGKHNSLKAREYIIAFAFLGCLHEWLRMASCGLGDTLEFQLLRSCCLMLTFVSLFEFARANLATHHIKVPGRWIIVLLASVGLLGLRFSIADFDILCRHVVVMPAGLLAGIALWIEGGKANKSAGLRTVGVFLLLYSSWFILLPPNAEASLTQRLEKDLLLAVIGVPAAAMQMLFALGCLVGFWIHYYLREPASERYLIALKLSFPAILIMAIILGWGITEQISRTVDADIRQGILDEANSVASAVNTESAKKLAFTVNDADNPEYKRLCRQLRSYSEYNKRMRGIYTLAVRDDKLVFGPESYNQNDDMASPPGTVYLEPTYRDWNVAVTGKANVYGPVKDEYGEFISALAPVWDEHSDKTIMVVGIDILADEWKSSLGYVRFLIILQVLAVTLFLTGGAGLLYWRESNRVSEAHWVIKHAEPLLSAMLGVGATALLVFAIYSLEKKNDSIKIERVADSEAKYIRSTLSGIGKDINVLSKYLENELNLSREGFIGLTNTLIQASQSHEFHFIKPIRNNSSSNNTAYQTIYTTSKNEALDDINNALENPLLLKAFQESAENKLPSVASLTFGKKLIYLVQPIYRDNQSSPYGYAVCSVKMEDILDKTINMQGFYFDVADVSAKSQQIIASYPSRDVGLDDVNRSTLAPYNYKYPLFLFNGAYAIEIHSSPNYHNSKLFWAPISIGFIGLLSTLLITIFVAFMRSKQNILQLIINQRTRQLNNSRNDLYITLNSIGDAVIATNTLGKITRMNPAAERLTGWDFASAEGCDISTVFNIFNAITHEPVECPVHKVLELGHTVELASDTYLKAKDGAVYYIADSAAPIIDDDGKVRGTVLVFHDISEQYRIKQELIKSEERFRLVMEAAQDGIWDSNLHDGTMYISPQWVKIVGCKPEEVKQTKEFWRSIVHPDDIEKLRQAYNNHVEGVTPTMECEHRLKTVSGEYRYFLVRGKIVEWSPDGKPLRMVGAETDITEQKRAEEQLQNINHELEHERAILQAMFDSTQVGMLLINEDGTVARINKAALQLVGKTDADLSLERRPGAILNCVHALKIKGDCGMESQCQMCALKYAVKQVLSTNTAIQGADFSQTFLIDGKEKILHLSINVKPVVVQGKKQTLVSVMDITYSKQAEQALDYQAHHDALTGLPNRRYFKELLSVSTTTNEFRKDNKLLLMFIDLDRFKMINDTLGHEVGDQVLIQSGIRLKSCLRETDLLARMGGDEFTAVIPFNGNKQEAEAVSQRMITSLSAPFVIGSHRFSIGASIGMAVFPDDGDTAELLVKHADAAMYSAKEAGRNRYKWYTMELTSKATERIQLERDLRNAIHQNELEVYYQPILNIRTNEIHGAEALLRWNSPSSGVIHPNAFISLAEETGLIIPIGDEVLRSACQAVKRWQDIGAHNLEIAVNISTAQFFNQDWFNSLMHIIREENVDIKKLCLEITETTLAQSDESEFAVINLLKDKGIRISIDDFGIGYSSFGRLKRFPIVNMKVDGSLIKDIINSTDDRAMIKSIITMAHSLGISVTAEWVENETQMNIIKELDCDYAQGYYVSAPLTAKEFEQFLHERYLDAYGKAV